MPLLDALLEGRALTLDLFEPEVTAGQEQLAC